MPSENHDDCDKRRLRIPRSGSNCQFPSSEHRRRSQYDLNNKIMLTAIISLSVVVVVVIVLHIYARYVLRRQARQRAAIRLGLIVSQVEPPKTGLDPVVIASLPVFSFKRTETGDEREGEAECAVCLSMLEDDEMARLLPNCKHTFHAECIDKWLGSQSTCPICRTEAEPRVVPELPELPLEGGGAPPTAPPVAPPPEDANSTLGSVEGTSSDGGIQPTQSSAKVNGSISRLSSFRRILSRERSSPRTQSSGLEEDIERQ
ncbi:RING-H2 finger protein ATL40-like [Rhododendron vialii]|uniref:RING-H2 finger protein ATL40-like n=1 Tax=Rhododendron vialii TaxID=182163 RepID=UPI00265FBDA7|nr:RING-H2 finger protein ATL40-like [Rhododendron vialii]